MKKNRVVIVVFVCVIFSSAYVKANSKLDTVVFSEERRSTIDRSVIMDLPQIVIISKNIFLTVDRNSGFIEEIYHGRMKIYPKAMVKNGFYLHFNNSKIDSIGKYRNNKKNGRWEIKDERGEWIVEYWKKGKLSESSRTK